MKRKITQSKLRTAMLFVLACLVMTAQADVTGTYDSSTRTLTFTGDGELTQSIVQGIEGYEDAESVVIGSGITAIATDDGVFTELENLTTVTLNSPAVAGAVSEYTKRLASLFPYMTKLIVGPDVTSIGDYAFCMDSKITEVDFSNATSLTTIGMGAFGYCSGLSSINLPSGVTTVGDMAFFNCYNASSVTVPASVTSIGEGAFYYIFINSDYVNNSSAFDLVDYGMQIYDRYDETLYMYLAKNDTRIVMYDGPDEGTITIPGTVTAIGNRAFSCYSGVTFDFSQATNLKTIGDNAFYYCNFKEFDFTNCTSLTSIGRYAFYGSYFNNLDLYSCTSLTTISKGAFENISVDYYIELPYSLVSIGDEAFAGCNYSEDDPYYYSYVTFDYEKESQLTTIGSYAFASMGLNYFTVPKNVTSIGEGAFSGNADLFSVTIESPAIINPATAYTADNNLTTIFPKIQDLTIGDDITAIGANCLAGSTTLEDVSFGEKVASIDITSFANCESLKRVSFASDIITKNEWTATDNIYTRYFPNLERLTLGRMIENPTEEEQAKDPNFYVGKYAFANASTLENLYIEGFNIIVNTNECAFLDCKKMSGCLYNLGNMGVQSFKGCESIEYVDIHGTTIEKEAFAGCTTLNPISLSYGLNTIGESAFEGCTGLESLDIPESVEAIGSKAFYGCTSLADVTTYREEPVVLAEEQQFDNIAEEATLSVIFLYVDKYKEAAVWKDFYAIKPLGFEYVDAADDRPTVEDSEYEPLIRYKRTFSAKTAGKWQCFYVPFSINLTEDILNVFEFAEVDKVYRYRDNMVMTTRILEEGDYIRSSKPCFIRTKSAEAGTYYVDIYSSYIYPEYGTVTNYFSAANDVECSLWGVYETTNVKGHYTLNVNGKFSYYTQDTNMKPNRWYMDVTDPVTAKRLNVVFEDEATDIADLPAAEGVKTAYSIDGRKLSTTDNLPAGFYIINGKKTYIK